MTGLQFNIIRKENLTSTQLYLNNLAQQEPLPEGSLIITENQVAGIGQEGNYWESEAGKNLTFSFLLKPAFLDPGQQFMLNKMVSLAVLHCLEQLPAFKAKPAIKWPNDIYTGNKKLAGILISNAIMGNAIEHSVIGIGMNVNQLSFSERCPNPTSVKIETGLEQDIMTIFNILLLSISEHYQALQYLPARLDNKYLEVLYQIQQWKQYEIQGQHVQAMIIGLDEYGKLQLEIKGDGIITCDLKEIKYL